MYATMSNKREIFIDKLEHLDSSIVFSNFVSSQHFHILFIIIVSLAILLVLTHRVFPKRLGPQQGCREYNVASKVNDVPSFLVTNHLCHSHGGEKRIKGLLPQDLPSDRVLNHAGLELG